MGETFRERGCAGGRECEREFFDMGDMVVAEKLTAGLGALDIAVVGRRSGCCS